MLMLLHVVEAAPQTDADACCLTTALTTGQSHHSWPVPANTIPSDPCLGQWSLDIAIQKRLVPAFEDECSHPSCLPVLPRFESSRPQSCRADHRRCRTGPSCAER